MTFQQLVANDVESSFETLNKLKQNQFIRRWSSTNFEPLKVSTKELQLVTRTSFSTTDYYADLLAGANQATSDPKLSFAIISIVSVLTSAFVIPQLEINGTLKNVFGLLGLFGPFLFLLSVNLFPAMYQSSKRSSSESDANELRDRVIYHEAGHFLACYLCGIPTMEYNIDGGIDAISIGARIPSLKSIENELKSPSSPSTVASKSEILIASRTGNLLIVSMAGIVAETLRCGNSMGGSEDFPIAVSILRLYGIGAEVDDYLRWAVLKALSLLRIYRDELDLLAGNMRDGRTVAECIAGIEQLPVATIFKSDCGIFVEVDEVEG